MNKTKKLIAITLVIMMLSLPILGDMNGDRSDGNDADDRGMMGSRNDDDSMRDRVKEMHENGSRIRDDEDMMGMGFIHHEDDSYGSYVTFSVDNATGDILNFGILGIAVFDSIKIPGFDFRSATTDEDKTRIVNNDGSIVIRIHDNPAAVIKIKANRKATLVFNLASGASAAKQDNIINIVAGNITAYIISDNTTSINIAGRQVSLDTGNGDIVFRSSPVNMPHDDMEERFMGEMMTKRAGAEVNVGDFDKSSIVNYTDDMDVMIRSMEKDRIRMTINSSDHSGKFVMMNIDNSSLMWNEGQKLGLYLDNKPMRQVMTEQELYDAKESSFWITTMGRNRMRGIMYIANFSERQVDIVVLDEGTPEATPEVTVTAMATPTPGTPGFGIALGVICAVTAYVLRRRS